MVEKGEAFLHVEAIYRRSNTMEKGGVEVVDRAVTYMGVSTGLKTSTGVAEKHKWPVGSVGMLFLSIIAGVDDQGVVHHRARAFRDGLQGFHELDQHLAVVLTDLYPDRIVGLVHMSKAVAG